MKRQLAYQYTGVHKHLGTWQVYDATEVDPLLTLAKQMRDALGWYVRTGRCENPTRKPLPNPKGYREYVRIVPCGECHWCRAYAAIAAYDKLMEDE